LIVTNKSQAENMERLLRGVHPFLGFDYYYRPAQTSSGIGSLARLQSMGPEFGIGYSIQP